MKHEHVPHFNGQPVPSSHSSGNVIDRAMDQFYSSYSDNALRPFFSSPSAWEILLIVMKLDGNPRYGIGDYIDMVKTGTSSRLTMYKFIRQRIDDGLFVISPGEKKSRKTLSASEELKRAFTIHFENKT